MNEHEKKVCEELEDFVTHEEGNDHFTPLERRSLIFHISPETTPCILTLSVR